jgi:hypothetical protein
MYRGSELYFFFFFSLVVKALFSNEHCPTDFFFFLFFSLVLFVYCLAIFSLIDCLIINGLMNCNTQKKGYVASVFVLRDVQCVDIYLFFSLSSLYSLCVFFLYVTHLLINNLCKHKKYIYIYILSTLP